MTERLVAVIDVLDPSAVDSFTRLFQLDALTKDLVHAGLEGVPIFVGRLEAAPDAWAYLLLASEAEIGERAQQQSDLKLRLERSIGTTHVPQRAATFAETLGLLGVLDNVASAWFGPRRKDPKAPNFLFIKRSLSAQLNWPLLAMNSSANYASTNGIAMPLPEMIVKYLRAALPKSDVSRG